MRRLVVAIVTGLVIFAVALSLHTLSDAMDGDWIHVAPSPFASPIDPPAVIDGTVFEDANGNGEQDLGESGIQGVTLRLRNSVSGTITTDPDGDYSFSPTWSGTYTLTAVTPSGYVGTTPEEVIVRITGPGQKITVDFGYRGIGTIYGTVFDDRDIDGMQEEGEPGISEVMVSLLRNGSTISTTPTAGDGSYQFASLFLGEYTVEETNPPGYTNTTPDIQAATLTTPGQEERVDFGDYGPSRVTGIVFNDLDGDGLQDAGERGISGVTVELLRGATAEFTATTDVNGAYFLLWDDLDDYTVRETDLQGYVSISPNEVEVVKSRANQVEVVNFADRGKGAIGGTVFDDLNGNQEKDGEEPGIPDVILRLLEGDRVVRTVSTDKQGTYEFVALGLEDFRVMETDPVGYRSTTPNAVTVTLTITNQVETVDFGDRGVGAVRGIVFDDENGDGELDPGEPGIDGATVTLLSNGSVFSTAITADDGAYLFDPVWLDHYTVRETDPNGYVSSTPNEVTVTLTMTQQTEVRNFGDRGVGTIQGTVFDDTDGNGIQDGEPGIEGVTVTLLQNGSPISATMTDNDGTYAFPSLLRDNYTVLESDPEGYNSTTPNEINVSIAEAGQTKTVDFGDRGVGAVQVLVFDDENGDGELGPDEPGIDGVTVTLLSNGSVFSTATTSDGGAYTFDPVWLDDYTVRETDPNGYVSTTPNELTATLTMTKQVRVRTFGDRGVGTIQGTVFDDVDGNGIQNGEPGIEGVTITLLQDGSTISATMTSADGTYVFPSLFLGDYVVQETDPENYDSTTDNIVEISLAAPGEEKRVDFGDRSRFTTYLPVVQKSFP